MSIRLSHGKSWFQLALFWSTKSSPPRSTILDDCIDVVCDFT
jgi:hypothetical protein